MKQISAIGIFALAAIGCMPISVEAIDPYLNKKQQMQSVDVSTPQMSAAEQKFAMKLSDLHRKIFTTVFTPALRKEAMDMMASEKKSSWRTPKMTPDMAVEAVIRKYRGVSLSLNQNQGNQQNSNKQRYNNNSNSSGIIQEDDDEEESDNTSQQSSSQSYYKNQQSQNKQTQNNQKQYQNNNSQNQQSSQPKKQRQQQSGYWD